MPQVRLKIADAEGELPPICMVCGDTATLNRTKKMSWCPPWVGVLILGGLLPYLIVVLILTKKARIQAPLCEDHKHHWLWRTLVISFSLVAIALVSILMFVVASVVNERQRGDALIGWVCLGVAVLFVLWLILVAVVNYSAIRPKEITEREILLDGVSPEFVEAYEEFAAQRPRRRRRPIDDDEEEEADRPPARKTRSGDTGIEERRRRRPLDDDE